jgi:ATP/maltotriose-dependent transcriptional regulator MalT
VAYFSDEIEPALESFQVAQSRATNSSDSVDALWGAVTCAIYADHPSAESLLAKYTSLGLQTPEYKLRVAIGHLAWSYSRGGLLENAIDANLVHTDLLPAVDPMIRCSFIHILGNCYVLNGRYSEAIEWVQKLRAEAREARFRFASLQAGLSQARLNFGLGRYADSASFLDRITSSEHDSYVHSVSTALWVRLTAVRGSHIPRAVSESRVNPITNPNQGEYTASRAMLHASKGEHSKARRLANRAFEISHSTETRAYASAAAAITAASTPTKQPHALVGRFLDVLSETQAFDALVCAYRIAPDLLGQLLDLGFSTERATLLLSESRDSAIARRYGLATGSKKATSSEHGLTPREREVLRLVEEGLTNREIAQRLFISQSTAKVHVRHILEKLGVRSRMEAAIRRRTKDSD